MLTIKEINSAIMFGSFTNDELVSIGEAIRFNRAQLAKETKRSLRIGSNVSFTSGRTGQNVAGVVTKIAIKNVTVKTANGLWRVPANMLEVVA
jgi:hypothetical protein